MSMNNLPVSNRPRVPPPVWGIAIAGAYLVFCLFTIDHFGITWDEPLHFRAGDLYLEKILQKGWLNFSVDGLRGGLENYGPFFDIVASFNRLIMAEKLKMMADDNARHLHLVVLSALTVFFTFLICRRGFSPRTAVFAAFFMVSFPRFIGHSFNNPKDIPITFIFLLCLYFFSRRLETGKKRYSCYLALAGGVGFSTRVSYIIVPAIIIVFLILRFVIYRFRSEPNRMKLLSFWDVILALFLSIPIGFLFWPYFWSQPLARLSRMLQFYYSHDIQGDIRILYQGNYFIPGKTLPWHYAPVILLITTPLFTLGFFLLGIIVLISRLKTGEEGGASNDFSLLLLLWMGLGLAPFLFPGQRVYGGIRHFLFIVPAFCAVAGRGLDYFISRFHKFKGKRIVFGAVAVIFLFQLIAVYSFHPFYTVYYNELVGGPRGAFERFSLENWGNAYKSACTWLNRNAAAGERILVLIAPQIPAFYLRENLRVLGPEQSRLPPSAYDYSLYIIRDADPLVYKGIEPVYLLSVKDQPILKIQRW